VKAGDWVVVVRGCCVNGDSSDGANPGHVGRLLEHQTWGHPNKARVTHDDHVYWWVQEVRPATPEEIAGLQLDAQAGLL
jgi:hypothetical protein